MNRYFEILDFVCQVKKIEFSIVQLYSYKGESVFRGVWDKIIPRRGTVIVDQVEFDFFFHGSGVDYESSNKRYHYNRSVSEGLGVLFTPLIHDDYSIEKLDLILEEYSLLVELNLIKLWMPEMQGKQYHLV